MTNKTFLELWETLEGESKKLLDKQTLDWYMAQIRNIIEVGYVRKDKGAVPPKPSPQTPSKSTGIFPSKTVNQLAKGVFITVTPLMVGSMVIYVYDAKTKATLPYWDKFPLVIPIKHYGDRFLGINFHYLPPYERANLLTALKGLINNKSLTEDSRLKLSYKVLDNVARFRAFKPCLKLYLSTHLRSRVSLINPLEWDRAILLPLANFQKATDFKVWQDSINSLKRRKK